MDKIKISFDYDGTLSLKRVQNFARKLNPNETETYILTSRFDNIYRLKYKDLHTNEDIYNTALDLLIPPYRISYTNQHPKWMVLNESGIRIHIDDDEREISGINYYGIVKPFSIHSNYFEEEVFNYIEALKSF